MFKETRDATPHVFFLLMNRWSFLSVLCLACAVSGPLQGANVVREVKKTIKGARYEENGDEARKVTERLNGAEKSLMDALPEEEKPGRRAELFYMAAMVQCRFNDIENEKIYLRRAYDTTLYYNSIYKTYKYLAQCDSVESAEDYGGKFKFRPAARKRLLDYRVNLLNAGRFYLRKKNYAEAFRFLDLYLSSARYPMLKGDFLGQVDTMYTRVAYWAVAAGYHIGAYEGVVRYVPDAMRYGENKEYVQEYLCRSLLALNDTAAWEAGLKRGVMNFPGHTYFFTSLQDYLRKSGMYDEALSFADRMIKYDPKNQLYWYTKALVYMRKRDAKNCIANCDVVLMLDSMHVGANYFKGLAYCNMAKEASEAMKKADLRSADYQRYKTDMLMCYAHAEQPLERMRKLAPDKASRWAPLLYQVYLAQNKGTEFAEMERVMEKVEAEKEE